MVDKIEYKTLEDEKIESLHQAFLDAFSEYEIPIHLPLDRFQEMLETRSYHRSFSVGAYIHNRLVGFVCAGVREGPNDRLEGYDVATGIIQEYQKKGIGSEITRVLLRKMRHQGFRRFTLEVLENNIPAQKAYLKNGFQITRKLHCYRIHPKGSDKEPEAFLISDEGALVGIDESIMNSFSPSWQNSFASYRNKKENHHILVIHDPNQTIIGYGIIHKESGNILQIGTADHPNRKNLVERVFRSMALAVPKESYSVLNIEEGSWMGKILPSLGFAHFLSQHEMEFLF